MISNPYSSLRTLFSAKSQSASPSLIAVKKNGKFSSTLILAPPEENPQFLRVFLKNVYIKMITKRAAPIKRRGEAWSTMILSNVWNVVTTSLALWMNSNKLWKIYLFESIQKPTNKYRRDPNFKIPIAFLVNLSSRVGGN
jgi:hypothetical protein